MPGPWLYFGYIGYINFLLARIHLCPFGLTFCSINNVSLTLPYWYSFNDVNERVAAPFGTCCPLTIHPQRPRFLPETLAWAILRNAWHSYVDYPQFLNIANEFKIGNCHISDLLNPSLSFGEYSSSSTFVYFPFSLHVDPISWHLRVSKTVQLLVSFLNRFLP